MDELHFNYERYPFLFRVTAVLRNNSELFVRETRSQSLAEDTASDFMIRDPRVEYCRIEEIRPWTKVTRI